MGLSSAVRLQVVSLLLLLCGFAVYAQVPRIAGATQRGEGVEVRDSVSPRALLAQDLGLSPSEKRLTNLSLRFSRTPRQQRELDQLLADQQNPASPQYHHWLTPEQFKSRFGLADSDLAKISTWLNEQGFDAVRAGRGGTFVRFQGTVEQAQRAFGAEIHQISLKGERHFANIRSVNLPSQFAALTVAITGLDDFTPKSHHVSGSASQVPSASEVRLQPLYTSSNGAHFLAPDDFHTIYDENALLSAGTTGAGVTVAVVGQTDITLSDIAAFRSAAGLSASAPIIALYGSDPGMTSNADFLESELDIEWAGATAPGAQILYVNSTSVVDGSLTEAIDKNLAPIISISYGDCEADLGVSSLAYYSLLLQQASAQGISVIAPAGDAGATDCDGNAASATHGYGVDFPASSPLVTGVGGTSFNDFGGSYFAATNNNHGGSALSYIPEVVWNDDPLGGISAGGGGRSDYFSKPAWQAGNGVPNDFARDLPDIVLNASPNHNPYLICTGNHCTNGFLNASGNVEFVGGTSVGPPAVAGLLALVMQKTGARLGNANPVLYALANSTYRAAAFHDISNGNNASPCTAGSTDCPVGGSLGFSATDGYDLATGLGSIDAFGLVTNWTSVSPVSTTTGPLPSFTNVSGDANIVQAGTPIKFTVSVKSASAGSTAVPTGTVQLTLNSVAIGSAVALSAGAATLTVDTTAFPVGRQTVQATYSGDATFMGSKAAFIVTITASDLPDFSFTPATATVTVASGQVAQGTLLTATALKGFNSKIQLTASGPTSLHAEYSFSANPIDLTTATAGTSTLILFAYTGAPQAKKGIQQLSELGATSRGSLVGPVIALAGLLSLTVLRRKRLPPLAVAIVAASALGLSGCSSTGPASPSSGNIPAKAGTYSILVTASATANGRSVVHSSTINFVVQ